METYRRIKMPSHSLVGAPQKKLQKKKSRNINIEMNSKWKMMLRKWCKIPDCPLLQMKLLQWVKWSFKFCQDKFELNRVQEDHLEMNHIKDDKLLAFILIRNFFFFNHLPMHFLFTTSFFSFYGSGGVPRPKSITLITSFSVVINTILSSCHVCEPPISLCLCTDMRFWSWVVGFFWPGCGAHQLHVECSYRKPM